MKHRKLLIIIGIILILSGCSDFMMICSLNPFYLEKNITLSPEIEGTWSARPRYSKTDSENKNSPQWAKADTALIWRINRFISVEKIKTKQGKDSTVNKPQNFYTVELTSATSDTVKYQFYLYVFRLNGMQFGDFSPREVPAFKQSSLAKENFFSVHTLARIRTEGGRLSMSWLGADYVKEMIEKKRVRIKYRYVPDAKRLLLTASSKDLTDMLDRYAGQKRFIDWENQSAMMQFTPINQ